MHSGFRLPTDLSLVVHDSLSDSYELSSVLLATADFEGTLQLLTSGWERLLGYGRQELKGKTLRDLLWSDHCGAADAVAAILERVRMTPVELRVRCRNGQGKRLRLHRRYDKHEQMMYIVADETPGRPATARAGHDERRPAVRPAA
jgi:PAS domain S-box-containing protein